MNTLEIGTNDYKGFTIKIEQDDDSINPRIEWDNLAVMTCTHSNYNLGDDSPEYTPKEVHAKLMAQEGSKLDAYEFMINNCMAYDEAEAREALNNIPRLIALPLYLYDHSGLSMSTGHPGCAWDTSDVGYIYITAERVLEEFGGKIISKKKMAHVINCLQGEVETYNDYLSGNVYGYIVEDQDGEQLDSSWGYFGIDRDNYIESCAIDVVEHHIVELQKEKIKQLKTFIVNRVPLSVRQAAFAGGVS